MRSLLITVMFIVTLGRADCVTNRFCNESVPFEFVSACEPVSCDVFDSENVCPFPMFLTIKTTSCRPPVKPGRYQRGTLGCQAVCLKTKVQARCCPGYYGSDCQECPGGAKTPCNHRGNCSSGISNNGLCKCRIHFKGTACELCEKKMAYGPNCDKECKCVQGSCLNGPEGNGSCVCHPGYTGTYCDQESDLCRNVTCMHGTMCVATETNATCVCRQGSRYHANLKRCRGVDPCVRKPCSSKALCSPYANGTHLCSCLPGYQGDGIVCMSINNCNFNNGGCDQTSSRCVHTGPGLHECVCRFGFTRRANGSCLLHDLCATKRPCHKHARCTMIGPNAYRCRCKENYVGDGTTCYGNLNQTLEEMQMSDPRLRGRLGWSLKYFSMYFGESIVSARPLTLFVPTDRAFYRVPIDGMREKLLLHTVAARLSAKDFYNSSVVYTLQGSSAEIQIRGEGFRFRIHGSRQAGKIISHDHIASNGVIHVVDVMMRPIYSTLHLTKKNAYYVLNRSRDFKTFMRLLRLAGLSDTLKKDNITVFRVPDRKWKASRIIMDYLNSTQGRPSLIKIMKNHIFNNKIHMMDLISRHTILSSAHITSRVTVTKKGQVKLNYASSITLADVMTSNAVMHDIDALMVPRDMGNILPRTCDVIRSKLVKGRCAVCHRELNCPAASDIPLDLIQRGCTLWVYRSSRRGLEKSRGCSRVCNRTTIQVDCCEGFYSAECKPCPGGFNNVCSLNGKCLDRISGNGTCLCKANFTGVMCERCEKPDFFGLECLTPCTCLYGSCDEGPTGTGKCLPRTCRQGYKGDNCDIQTTPCSPIDDGIFCHVHASCVRETHVDRCICHDGYEGDGLSCTEVDPCRFNPQSCHLQARCIKTGPGKHRCECKPGYIGDGQTLCTAISACSLNTECHANASCRDTTPGQYICMCNAGYHGNGTFCSPTNPCVVNNGGCHLSAKCEYVSPGRRNCTCSRGYVGDGVMCYSTIDVEIATRPQLMQLAQLMKVIPEGKNHLSDMSKAYTFFAPSNHAVTQFKSLANASSYWSKGANIITMFAYHTVRGSLTIETMLDYTRVLTMGKVKSLVPGFSLHIQSINQTLYVNGKRVLAANIPTLNGYIHIIDGVLEPYLSSDNQPLWRLFQRYPQFALFGQYLKDFGLLQRLDKLHSYTLFLLSNDSLSAHVHKYPITRFFLSMYIVPEVFLSPPTLDWKRCVPTISGRYQQVCLNVSSDKSEYTVNGIPLTGERIVMRSRIAHVLEGVLPASVRECRIDTSEHAFGKCVPCMDASLVPCPNGYSAVSIASKSLVECWFTPKDKSGLFMGCQRLCSKTQIIKECCKGFYGKECTECPGGALNACSGHGKCWDGKSGAGHCWCMGNFVGATCNRCRPGYSGATCNVTVSRSPCDVDNGGCHRHAFCSVYSGNKVSCTCYHGYVGDGWHCHRPCGTNTTICAKNASCHDRVGQSMCICDDGFTGDGYTLCSRAVGKCAVYNGGCHQICNHSGVAKDPVICSCWRGYIKYGAHRCNGALLYTILSLPFARGFIYSVFRSDNRVIRNVSGSPQSLLDEFSSSMSNLTIFLPDIHPNVLLTSEEILDYIVDGAWMLSTNEWPSTGVTVMSRSNKRVFIEHTSNKFYVNKIPVLVANIPSTNGIVHIIASLFTSAYVPFKITYPPMQRAVHRKSVTIPVVVGAVCAAVVIVSLVVGVLWYTKYRAVVANLTRTQRVGSQSSVRPLHADNCNTSASCPSNTSTNFDNPLYNVDISTVKSQ